MNYAMKENIDTRGLGSAGVPAGYNTPGFGVGTAAQAGPGPDQQLIARSAADTPNGIDPLNRGFSIGGADDPLAEFEGATDSPAGMDIGGGSRSSPMNSPSHPAMASMKEDEFGAYENETFLGEDDDPFAENDSLVFEDLDAIPDFEDVGEDPELAALPVDASGVIDPVVIPEEDFVEPELGEIPDVTLPLEEPILELTAEDADIQIPENVFENDGIPESIPVLESFKLPENQSVIISKGDQIFLLGRVREEFTPKYSESVFSRALKALCENKGDGCVSGVLKGRRNEKVAAFGRSLLVEVAKDWRLPGTGTIFEARDLLQIVSAKPVYEGREADGEFAKGKKEKDAVKAKEEAEAEKLKKEASLAFKRWREADRKRKEGDSGDDDDDDDGGDDDDPEKKERKAKKERAKREAAFLERQRTGGLI
jgi:hypothetical protein